MAVVVSAVQLVSPNEVGIDFAYDGNAGTGVTGTITGAALRAALAAAPIPESQSALRWWYAQAFLPTAAAGRSRYLGIGVAVWTPGTILRGAVPYGYATVYVGANQNPAINCNANGDDVEVSFLGAVACSAFLKLGIKPSIIV